MNSNDSESYFDKLLKIEMSYKESVSYKKLQEYLNSIRRVAESIPSINQITMLVEKLAAEQYVVVYKLPRTVLDICNVDSIGRVVEKHIVTTQFINEVADMCENTENILFVQAVEAMKKGDYNLALLGLTATLDKVLADYSGMNSNVNIKKRCDQIVKSIKSKGEIFIDELEGIDYLLFISYYTAIESFGNHANFDDPEPEMLNRHWIMHGRSNKVFDKTSCFKLLCMIAGTIRLGKISNQ